MDQYEKIGLMGLVFESNIKMNEKIALIESIKDCDDIEFIAPVLEEFKIIDEHKANFLVKSKDGLKVFGNKAKGRWSEFEKNRQKTINSSITKHFRNNPQATPPGTEFTQGLNSALS